MKSQGSPSLSKIANLVGRPIAIDKATMDKSKTELARVLIEMELNGVFPETLNFVNEIGKMLT